MSAMGALPSQIAFELLAEDGRYSSPSWSVKGHCHTRPVRDQARTAVRAVQAHLSFDVTL